MNIRKAEIKDLPFILDIYSYAREVMRQNGNPNQWKEGFPSKDLISSYISDNTFYVVEEKEEICGVFYFKIGIDETYVSIDGEWLNDDPYGAIHLVASSGKCKGVMPFILSYCEKQIDNLKMDTHKDNLIMRHVLTSNGFVFCGTIDTDDKEGRLVFQKTT